MIAAQPLPERPALVSGDVSTTVRSPELITRRKSSRAAWAARTRMMLRSDVRAVASAALPATGWSLLPAPDEMCGSRLIESFNARARCPDSKHQACGNAESSEGAAQPDTGMFSNRRMCPSVSASGSMAEPDTDGRGACRRSAIRRISSSRASWNRRRALRSSDAGKDSERFVQEFFHEPRERARLRIASPDRFVPE